MKFSLERFGLGNNRTETPPVSTEPETMPEAISEVTPEAISEVTSEVTPDPEAAGADIGTSRRNFLRGATALAGSVLIGVGTEAEAARLPGESNIDYIERSRRELKERRQNRSQERSQERIRDRDNRYGTRPNRQPETLPRVETRGAMEYVGFYPSLHEQRILGIRLSRLIPNAVSIQIVLQSESQFKTQNLRMSIINEDGTTLSVVGAPVFTEPGVNINMPLINKLLERLEQKLSTK